MNNLNLQCKCGSVQGVVENVTPKSGNRCICFCKDCQAFPTELGVADSVLDEHGGTELFQAPLSHVKITQGSEHLRCLRLTKKGLYRWYTDCCNTVAGNTVSAKIPFFGIVHSFMKDEMDRTELLGPIRGAVFIKHAKDGYVKPKEFASELGVNLRVIGKLLVWKLKSFRKPSAFFDENGRSISKPRIISTRD